MYVFYNPNYRGKFVDDCVIRAICKATGEDWQKIYMDLAVEGLDAGDMMDSNEVWGKYLHKRGYRRYVIPSDCPTCYSIREFCLDYPTGNFILATGSHVVAVQDGNYYDSYDSGDKAPIYYWRKEK